ncbi:MAG: [protein-PII] uridylyltransferase [Deltaproteobacteria bacterium]|nr:[protein-PII] uridylyltransferase [Deltaproteobacteria bacterium]MBW2360319.1 [protein-PII] uridylyltransferase [Deltaproteobacteria bacterium]
MNAAPNIDRFLAHGPDAAAEDVSARVRDYLSASSEFLEHVHRGGASGAAVNAFHSDLMDRLVRRLFDLAEEFYFADGGDEAAGLCILAAGGYARREMNIHSDVDLLFLYRDKVSNHVAAVAERVQVWLWDANLAVGAATRTIEDTISLARKDTTVATSILASRFLAGSGLLFYEFQERVRSKLFSNPGRFIDEQLEAQLERYAHFGDSLYLLQPNLKDGAGALRDYHLAWWVMQVTHVRAGGADDFLHLGLLTESEVGELRAALDFLWRTRNELHLMTGRKTDQLSFEIQEQLAKSFGYAGDGPELPVERFMSDYYRHARAIQTYSSLVVEQCRQRISRPRRRRVRQVARGFRIADGQLEVPHVRLLREDPVRLLEAFSVAQDEDVRLTRKARRLIREHLHLVDDAYRHDARARAIFLRILESPRRVMRSLIGMNEVGLLGAFLPEWQHVVCRWQHVMYHTYTIDVHMIFLVEELRRLWLGEYESEAPELCKMMRACDDRAVLFLGCLMHDIGKGLGGNHSVEGVARAGPCLQRLGLSQERIDRILFLVEHHLLMSHLAQRRDLSDPRLILEFAQTVGDRTNLRNLYLLTFADIRASSMKAWTSWKGDLLRELFEQTAELLETGGPDPGRALALVGRRVEARREAAEAMLRKQGIDDARIHGYFDTLPQRYFTAHSPKQIERHAGVLLGLEPEQAFRTARREMRGGFTEFILCTKDVHGLYSNVAGTLTAYDINILGAHVYSTRDGHALEVYRVSTPAGGEGERRLVWDEIEASLARVLAGDLDVADLLVRRGRRVGAEAAHLPSPSSVSTTNEESEFYTIVDVSADDRLGLLHDLTRTIAEHGFEIYISKASQSRDQVTDTFYLKDAHGKKVADGPALETLRCDLLAAAQPSEDGSGR